MVHQHQAVNNFQHHCSIFVPFLSTLIAAFSKLAISP